MNWGAASGQVLLLRETDKPGCEQESIKLCEKGNDRLLHRERKGEREGGEREIKRKREGRERDWHYCE